MVSLGPDETNGLKLHISHIQSNLNSSNTDGSFTDNSWFELVFSPYEILPVAQENI